MSSRTVFRLGVPQVTYGSTLRSMFSVALFICACTAVASGRAVALNTAAVQPQACQAALLAAPSVGAFSRDLKRCALTTFCSMLGIALLS